MPTNVSALTALAVTADVPVTVDLTGLAAPFTTWYVYTVRAGERLISAWARPETISGATNSCRFAPYLGPAAAPVPFDYWGDSELNKPKLLPLTSTAPTMTALPAGTLLLFEVVWSGGTVPNRSLLFTVYAEARVTAPVGSLVVSADGQPFPLSILGWDGYVKGFIHHPNGEGGAMLLDGVNAHTNKQTGDLDVYDATHALVTSLDLAKSVGGNTSRVSSDRTSTFYVNYPGVAPYAADPAVIYRVSAVGVLQATLPFVGYGITRHAPTWDNTILYFCDQVAGVVKRWDLVNAVLLADFYTLPASHVFKDEILVLGDGSVVIPIRQTVVPYAEAVVHRSAAGSTINTIPFPGGLAGVGTFLINRMCNGLEDDTFVVWSRDTTILNRFAEYQADGTLVRTVDYEQFDANGNSDTTTASDGMAVWGPANSCPLMVMPTTLTTDGPGPEPEPEPGPDVTPGYHLDARYIRRLRRAPHVANEHKRVFYRRFELDLDRGQALATGQGSAPVVLFRLSRDGGQTWGEELRLDAGALGDYRSRVIARRLGEARDGVFEIVVSDPIAWRIVGAWLDLEPGGH